MMGMRRANSPLKNFHKQEVLIWGAAITVLAAAAVCGSSSLSSSCAAAAAAEAGAAAAVAATTAAAITAAAETGRLNIRTKGRAPVRPALCHENAGTIRWGLSRPVERCPCGCGREPRPGPGCGTAPPRRRG